MEFVTQNIWLILTAIVSGGMLLWPNLRKSGGGRLSQLQATQLINHDKAVLVDIREPAEFSSGHLRNARNIPLKELPARSAELSKFKHKTVIAICQSGMSAGRAVAVLRKAGFDKVALLDGGVTAWKAQGLPLAR